MSRLFMKEIQNMGFPREVVEKSLELYIKYAKNRARKGNRRNVVYVCVLLSYEKLVGPIIPYPLADALMIDIRKKTSVFENAYYILLSGGLKWERPIYTVIDYIKLIVNNMASRTKDTVYKKIIIFLNSIPRRVICQYKPHLLAAGICLYVAKKEFVEIEIRKILDIFMFPKKIVNKTADLLSKRKTPFPEEDPIKIIFESFLLKELPY